MMIHKSKIITELEVFTQEQWVTITKHVMKYVNIVEAAESIRSCILCLIWRKYWW